MRRMRWMMIAGLLIATTGVIAPQEVPLPPPGPGEEEEESESRGSSLQPRPDSDSKTEAWVASLGAARPVPLSVEDGVLLHHVMAPQGDRFYYYRIIEEVKEDADNKGEEPDDNPGKPTGPRYALYTVGPERSETQVAETGGASLPPLFLGDGRMLFTTCRYDLNDDGALDNLDPATLMVGNRDGGNLRHVATLEPGDVPVAVWRDDSEVLLATEGEEGVNGWIVSLNLVSGERENIVTGFNVELVLDDGRLLIERQQPPPEEEAGGRRGWNRWGQPVIPEEQDEEPEPTLLDHSSHIVFNPKDGSEVTLFSPGRRARVTVVGDGSYFGHQERESGQSSNPWAYRQPSRSGQGSEVLIVDDPQHRDTRSPSERFDYLAIGWIQDRGLLVVEKGNLGSRLLLFDLALKVHRLADFDLNAGGFCASADGLTVGWLEIDDTDKNGYLQPWEDHARPRILKLE